MGIDRTAAEQALNYFATWLEFRQRYLQIPGVQAAVYLSDRIAVTASYGWADLERRVPMTDRHLFRIASHSKTFTATAVLRLVERGALRLDDRAGAYVHQLSDAPPAVSHITVRELLSHASGLFRDGTDGDFWQLQQPFPDKAGLLQILHETDAPTIPRNERFKYSNIGYGLLGLILEAAGGAPYPELVRREVLDRLPLRDTGPELDPGRLADYATGYSARGYAETRVPIEHVDTRALASATGFYSTAGDVVTYFSAHFLGDERLLSDDSKRQMQQRLWEVKEGVKHYASGLAVSKVGDRIMLGHGGGYPGHITSSVFDPADRIAVSVFTNAVDGAAEPLAHAAVRLVDHASSGADTAADGATLERFAGRFANLWGVVDVAVLGGRLCMLDPAADDPVEDLVELAVMDSTTLKIVKSPGYGSYGELVHYDFAPDGRVRSLRGPSAMTLRPLEGFGLPEVVRAPRAGRAGRTS